VTAQQEPIGPDPAHGAGEHIDRLDPDCWQCQRIRPEVERTAEQVRYILTGSTKPPERFDLDEDLLLDERFWDLGADDEPIELGLDT
jgi:hypothetical protein